MYRGGRTRKCYTRFPYTIIAETLGRVSRFGKWVQEFGDDLYGLAKLMTKNEEIKNVSISLMYGAVCG